MLYNLIIIALALAIPVSAFLCFKVGYKTGRAVREEKEVLPKVFDMPRARERPTEEQMRLDKILANIDAYDGSREGQVRL